MKLWLSISNSQLIQFIQFMISKQNFMVGKQTSELIKYKQSETFASVSLLIRQQIINIIAQYMPIGKEQFDQATINILMKAVFKIDREPFKSYLQSKIKQGVKFDTIEDLLFCVDKFMAQCLSSLYLKETDEEVNFITIELFTAALSQSLTFFNIDISSKTIINLFESFARNEKINILEYKMFLQNFIGSGNPTHFLLKIAYRQLPKKLTIHSNPKLLYQKIAKLVYSQLKVTLIHHNSRRKLKITFNDAISFLAQVFGLLEKQQQEILQKVFVNREDEVPYKPLLIESVFFYTSDINFRGDNYDLITIKRSTFYELMNNTLFFIKVKPSNSDLQLLFDFTDTDRDDIISRDQYKQMLKLIFYDYQF